MWNILLCSNLLNDTVFNTVLQKLWKKLNGTLLFQTALFGQKYLKRRQ